jgi:hypothetical protein
MRPLLLLAGLAPLAALAACWTGSTAREAAPAEPAVPAEKATPYLRVRLERTPCLGDCPTYTIEIDGTRRVARWSSTDDMDSSSRRSVRVGAEDLRALDRLIASSQFFDRDERGNMPVKPECTNDGTTTTCSLHTKLSFCSDTSHAIIAVSRGIRSHTVDYDFCNDNPEMIALTRFIERLARVRGEVDE